MAVEHVLSTYGVSTGAITITQDFQPGDNPLLMVALMSGASLAISSTAPSVNGTVMTLAASTHNTQCRTEVWYHAGFGSGSITVTVPNTLRDVVRVIVGSYKNVNQASPFTTTKSIAGTSSNATISMTGLTTGSAAGAGFVYGAFTHQSANVATGHNYTTVFEFDEGQWVNGVQHGIVSTADSTILWGVAASTYWAGVAVGMAPAAGAYNLSPVAGNISITVPTPPAFWQQHTVSGAGNIIVTCGAAPFSQEQPLTVPAVNIVVSGRVPVLAVFQTLQLGPDDNWMVVSASDPVIAQAYGLPSADGNIAVTCAPVSVTQTHALSVSDGNLAITCDAVPVIQTHNLDPSEIKYNGIRVTCGAVAVTTGTPSTDLSPVAGNLTVTCAAVTLTQTHILAPEGTVTVSCGAVVLTQAYTVAPEGTLKVTCGTVELTQTHALSASDGAVTVTAGAVSLSGDYDIAPQAGNIAVTCGAVTLTQAYHLAVDGGYISPTVDAILIEQYHALSVSDGVVSVTAGVVQLGRLLSAIDDIRTMESRSDVRSMVRAREHYTLHNIDR